MITPERDYGLPNIKEAGIPEILQEVNDPCPNCGCLKTFAIKVEVTTPLLKGGKGISFYCGCAACPWASKSFCTSS